MKPDTTLIEQHIKEQLSWDDRVVASEINVEVSDSTVKLTGVVPTYNAKLAAETDALVVSGVTSVDNRLNVKYPSEGERPTDTELRNNIFNILKWNSNIDETSLNVDVEDGLVTLEGSVTSYWKKTLAEDLVYSVKGVLSVTNKLSVVPTKDVVDEVIAENITNALDRNQRADIKELNVKVDNGAVTLSGFVPDWHAREEVYRTALYAKGVIDINDKLQIKAI